LRLIPRSFVLFAVGGPALIVYVSPTEEELFLRYNPELQKRSLENRKEKQEDFDNFVGKLKEYSKSDKTSTLAAKCWTIFIN
jgi:CBP4